MLNEKVEEDNTLLETAHQSEPKPLGQPSFSLGSNTTSDQQKTKDNVTVHATKCEEQVYKCLSERQFINMNYSLVSQTTSDLQHVVQSKEEGEITARERYLAGEHLVWLIN